MKPLLLLLFRIFLGAIFLIAGLAKFLDLSGFAFTLGKLNIVPIYLISPISYFIPTIEILLGLALIIGIFIRYATISIFCLLIIFSIVILIQIFNKNVIDCNCFGPFFSSRFNIYAFFRNLVLAFLALIVLSQNSDLFSMEKSFRNSQIENQRSRYQFLKNNWLENLAITMIILVLGLCVVIIIPLFSGSNKVLDRIDLIKSMNKSFSREQLINVSKMKELLIKHVPHADSISVIQLDFNIELFNLFSKRKIFERYIGVIEDVECKSCEDLHFLIKLSEEGKILNLLFLSPLNELEKQKLTDQFLNIDIQNLIKNRILTFNINTRWDYYFLKGLRNAGNALGNYRLLNESK